MFDPVCHVDGDPKTAKVMFIGEAPDKEEAVAGRGLVGRNGRLLWSVGAKAGLDRSSCVVTNAVQSWPALKSGKPSVAQLSAEWDRLEGEMVAFQGTVVVLVGGVAVSRCLGLEGGITDWRGYCLYPGDAIPAMRMQTVKVGEYKTNKKCGECQGHGWNFQMETGASFGMPAAGYIPANAPKIPCKACGGRGWKYQKGDPKYARKKLPCMPQFGPNVKWVIPILDPAGVLRAQCTNVTALRADLGRVMRATRDEIRLIDCVPYCTEPSLPPEGVNAVTIDIETARIAEQDWVMERVGVAWTHGGRIHTWTAPWNEPARQALKVIMGYPGLVKRFHNCAYDVPFLERAGCPLHGEIEDTMWAAQFLNPDLPKGLGRVAPLYFDMRPWKGTKDKTPEDYNAKDAYVQERLGNLMMPMLERQGQTRAYRAMMDGLPTVMAMTERGIKCDPVRLESWSTSEEDRMSRAFLDWPWPEVNPRSTQQTSAHLYYKLRLPKQYTKEGGLSTDATACNALIEFLGETGDNPLALQGIQTLLTIRECHLNLKTYAKVRLGADSCVHPQFLPTDREEQGAGKGGKTDRGQGARTGRIQPRGPNIANQSGESRKIYVPHHEDWSFIAVDWQQAEAWIEAHLSGDERLMEALEIGLHDFVQSNLEQLLGQEVKRKASKETWYASRNLARPQTICKRLKARGLKDATTEMCDTLQQGLYRLFPKWSKWRMNVVEMAEARGYVQEPFGRRYPITMRGRLRSRAVGFTPQTALGVMLWDRLPYVDNACMAYGGFLTLTVHDEFIGEGPTDTIAEQAADMQDQLECEWPEIAEGFSLKTDVEIGAAGESWGDMNERHA